MSTKLTDAFNATGFTFDQDEPQKKPDVKNEPGASGQWTVDAEGNETAPYDEFDSRVYQPPKTAEPARRPLTGGDDERPGGAAQAAEDTHKRNAFNAGMKGADAGEAIGRIAINNATIEKIEKDKRDKKAQESTNRMVRETLQALRNSEAGRAVQTAWEDYKQAKEDVKNQRAVVNEHAEALQAALEGDTEALRQLLEDKSIDTSEMSEEQLVEAGIEQLTAEVAELEDLKDILKEKAQILEDKLDAFKQDHPEYADWDNDDLLEMLIEEEDPEFVAEMNHYDLIEKAAMTIYSAEEVYKAQTMAEQELGKAATLFDLNEIGQEGESYDDKKIDVKSEIDDLDEFALETADLGDNTSSIETLEQPEFDELAEFANSSQPDVKSFANALDGNNAEVDHIKEQFKAAAEGRKIETTKDNDLAQEKPAAEITTQIDTPNLG